MGSGLDAGVNGNKNSTPQYVFFKRTCQNPFASNQKSSTNTRDLAAVSGGLFGFLQQVEFCRRTSGSIASYQTVSVFRLFVFFVRLFNPKDVRGSCGDVCTDICNHQPCVADYVSPDDALCECFVYGEYN
jgi:hypothetical protein